MSKALRQARYLQNLKIRAYNSIGWKCLFCRSDKIQLAHVIKTNLNGSGRGGSRRYMDVIKNPKHYRPMCQKCHYQYDKLQATLNQTK